MFTGWWRRSHNRTDTLTHPIRIAIPPLPLLLLEAPPVELCYFISVVPLTFHIATTHRRPRWGERPQSRNPLLAVQSVRCAQSPLELVGWNHQGASGLNSEQPQVSQWGHSGTRCTIFISTTCHRHGCSLLALGKYGEWPKWPATTALALEDSGALSLARCAVCDFGFENLCDLSRFWVGIFRRNSITLWLFFFGVSFSLSSFSPGRRRPKHN